MHTEHWEELKQVTKRYHEPGKFVTFLGYEWSGTTPGGGDHNVYTTDDDMTLHRSSHWQVPDKSDEHNDRYPITELYDTLRPLQHKIMVVPHVGGRYANLEFHDPELEPVVEICSCHGRFEWFFEEAIKRGYKTGVVATGDDHTGRPGSSYPTGRAFGVRNGLTAVLSVDRTRQSIWEALKARRCYATSGERILLEFGMRDHHMGEEVLTSTPPEFWVHVVGTAPLHSVEIRRALDSVYSYPLNQDPDPSLIRVAWGGNRLRSRKRYADWSGNLTLTGGKIVSAKGFAFDNPAEGITGWNERSVSWQSHTSGDIDGVIVEVDAPDSARLCFDSPVTKFSLDLSRIRATEQRIDAGGVDLFVSLSTVPRKPNPSEIEATHKDTPPQGVCVPYYVRVMQSDGEMAWSSPIFVTYVPEHRR